MSTPSITPLTPEQTDVQVRDFLRASNEAHAAGKAPPKFGEAPTTETAPVTPVAAPVTPANEDAEEGIEPVITAKTHPTLSSRDRRVMNRAIKEAAYANGQLSVLREIVGKLPSQQPTTPVGTTPAAEAKVELPKRETFKQGPEGDAEWGAALARHFAKEEVTKVVTESDAQRTLLETTAAKVQATEADHIEQVALIPDWETAIRPTAKTYLFAEHQSLGMLFALSPMRALITEYMVRNPGIWESLTELDSDPLEQRDMFKQLEGEMRVELRTRKAAKTGPKIEKLTVAQRDAKLPPPSETITPKSGTGDTGAVEMILANGDLNPAWKAQENLKRGVRK